ncbi:putative nucleotidyltransferase substrate binding domain-containing protein [Halomonas sp. HNIBRBA4712]|uniref:putative nucleotidyltransferase substrate binding domain-containing protein n=1 Tax=Halomonas sp. HNIBRBA4712 TaxID=3373087 RepID=UPI0037456562
MIEIDLTRPPFSLLDESGIARVRGGLDLAYFDPGDVILDANQTGESVFIIHKGEVAELDPQEANGQARIGHYTAGDLFGAISLLNGKSRYRFEAEQETLCYVLSGQTFRALCQHYPTFEAFFRESLAHKAQLLTERRAMDGLSMAGFMLARVRECMRAPVVIDQNRDIQGAVQTLLEQQADSLLVAGESGYAMVTKTDLLNALVIEGKGVTERVDCLARAALVTASPAQYLFEALVLMTRHKVARVVVMEEKTLCGIVELTDVLSYFSSRSYVVGLQIEKARDMAELARASRRTPELVRALMAQGVKLRFVMELLAALNARIVHKAWAFSGASAFDHTCCLVVMGSEGRGEQILKTDQDNALILEDGADAGEVAAAMAELSRTLVELGYPPCPGDIMVSNPEWVGSVATWQARIERWADLRDGESLMKLAILLDARPVAGKAELARRVRQALFDRCAEDELLLGYLARAALNFSTPLTLFGSLKKREHGIDIKKGGLFPIIHGVRTMALERRIEALSTLERLEALVADGRLEARFAEDLGEALALFTELRLRQQLGNTEKGAPINQVVVQHLSSLERDLLREALHIVKEFKSRLTHRYHLEYA